jgi:hypothetical protein
MAVASPTANSGGGLLRQDRQRQRKVDHRNVGQEQQFRPRVASMFLIADASTPRAEKPSKWGDASSRAIAPSSC